MEKCGPSKALSPGSNPGGRTKSGEGEISAPEGFVANRDRLVTATLNERK